MCGMDPGTELRRWTVSLLSLSLFLGASRSQAQDESAPEIAAERQLQIQTLRADAAAKLARGQWVEARASFDKLLALNPNDAEAKRDAGRAAMAAGELEYAARVLEEAHHGGGHHHDPELHYLRGEALYALGRTDEARAEHRIAELEIGLAPRDRMSTLWLARVHARRGETGKADRLYEGLWPPEGQPPDVEVAINHADAHLLVKDWSGAERILRRSLSRSPNDLRERHMLAWTLEAQGKLADELTVRGRLAADDPSAAAQIDYGRALERDGDYRAALGAYETADRAGGTDATLVSACITVSLPRSPPESASDPIRRRPARTFKPAPRCPSLHATSSRWSPRTMWRAGVGRWRRHRCRR
jgi:tetratricopeptide (TPR) repeat protein